MGNYEISFYHDIPDGSVQIVPDAPEGLRSHACFRSGTDSYRAIGNLRHVEVTYYELETEE